jgi:hypothetical protein
LHRTEEFDNVFFPESVLREAVEIMEKRTGEAGSWTDANIHD